MTVQGKIMNDYLYYDGKDTSLAFGYNEAEYVGVEDDVEYNVVVSDEPFEGAIALQTVEQDSGHYFIGYYRSDDSAKTGSGIGLCHHGLRAFFDRIPEYIYYKLEEDI